MKVLVMTLVNSKLGWEERVGGMMGSPQGGGGGLQDQATKDSWLWTTGRPTGQGG